MNIKKKTIKTILGCTTACSALLVSGVGAMNLIKPENEVFAAGADVIPVSISNSNFNTSTSSSYPFSPNSYTAYSNGTKVESSTNIESNIKAGVINLTNEKYESRFNLAKETTRDDYVLMIDSKEEESDTYHEVNYGFQTNSAIKLDANSKYMISADVFTATNGNIASLYLFDNKGEVFSEISNINSYNQWTTYTFFIATNSSTSVELKLGMYLEGAGTVLFDNLSASKLSDKEYKSTINSLGEATNFTEENKVDNIVKVFAVDNMGNFVDVKDNSNTSSLTAVEFDLNNSDATTLTCVDNTDGENTNALLIKNEEKTFVQYETDSIMTFEQNRVYKVSVNVKTKSLDGTASLQLIRTDIDEDDKEYDSENHNKTIKITSNTVSSEKSVTNDYKTYSFFINSHNSKTLTYKLKFGLGLEDALTSGEMYVSEIEISKVNYEAFNNATTGSDTEKINFVDAYADSKIMLNNGDFNAFKIADYNAPMPATPVDWEVSIGKNTQQYGVVNTQTFADDLKDLSLSNLSNPDSSKNNNVLMMYNETADTLSYTSKSKKLTEKTYHKFEIDVQTQNAPLTVSLVSKKEEKEIVLASKQVNTNNLWETITLYIHTGYQPLDVSLKLTLNTESYGYAYADNAKFDYLLTSSQLESEFKGATNSANTVVVDLTKLDSSASNEKFAQAQNFTYEKVAGVESGTLTLKSNYLDEVIDNSENLTEFNSLANNEADKKVLGIWSTDDVAYSMTSNVGFKLSPDDNKFYKITVDVFTQNLGANNNETNLDLVGAGIKLSGFDNAFSSIKSNNKWSTYTFYFQSDSDATSYLELSLGSEQAKTKGSVFFGNINFYDDVTEQEFNSQSDSEFVKIIKSTQTTNDDNSNEETNNETTNSSSNTTWIYLIPGLLTALAILIALVGFLSRKIKWKKPTKKSKTSYDRNKTVSVQYYTRKATTLREEKIREMTADLEKINSERKKFEDEYKQDLTKLREMKIKRANPNEISKLEKELKKNQKLSANLGVTANRISADLEYAKTDAYLNALVKKLARESSNQTDENKEEK